MLFAWVGERSFVVCELVGAFLLHNIKKKYGNNFGLYRDDSLGISNTLPRQVETSARSLTSMALRSQLKPTRKSRISLTSPLTCLTAYTCPTLNPTTSHFTSTRSPTIHHRSVKTSHYPSTNTSLGSHMMKHPSTKLCCFTRKPLMTVDTSTASSFQRLPLRNLLTLTEKTDTEILFGTTRPTQYCAKAMQTIIDKYRALSAKYRMDCRTLKR